MIYPQNTLITKTPSYAKEALRVAHDRSREAALWHFDRDLEEVVISFVAAYFFPKSAERLRAEGLVDAERLRAILVQVRRPLHDRLAADELDRSLELRSWIGRVSSSDIILPDENFGVWPQTF